MACGAGCAGSGSAQSKQGSQLQDTVVRMDARSRADRDKIRDLEHELSTLKRRLVDTGNENGPALPALPVEVRAPDAGADQEVVAAGPEHGQVVGVDDEGNEIIYVGDAARAESVRPRLPRQVVLRGTPAPRSAAEDEVLLPTIEAQLEAARNERLPVTAGVGPTVDRRLRDAAAPTSAPLPAPLPPPSSPGSASSVGRAPAILGPEPAPQARVAARSSASTMSPRSEGDATAQYTRHLEALRAGDHETAIAGFRAFVARSPGHDLADNAQYWLSEALYDQRRYREALLEFRKVVDNYPRGNKVPDALLKIGYCHAALGELDNARAALEMVISMFPKSKSAALAAQRIQTLAEK